MELVIRPARMDEVEEIWDLLHANMIAWTDERIGATLSKLWVMVLNSKILGVLKGNFEAGEIFIERVVIHPLYPEKQFQEAMIKGFYTIVGLDRGQARGVLSDYELAPGLG